MYEFDYFIPHFITCVRGTRIVVTLDLIFEVLHVPWVEFVDYPDCDHLRTVSKDELMSLFYETPSFWGDCQNTPCSAFAKGPRFLNMVITFVLHPFSHYNSKTKLRDRFLLSLLEGLTIDFLSHFILSLIDIYKDTTTRDKFMSLFYETPSLWGDRQNTPCSAFAKGPRFLNMVITFVLHPMSHYNSKTKPHARFLLSRLSLSFHTLPYRYLQGYSDP